jgi:hypothetical protein
MAASLCYIQRVLRVCPVSCSIKRPEWEVMVAKRQEEGCCSPPFTCCHGTSCVGLVCSRLPNIWNSSCCVKTGVEETVDVQVVHGMNET